MVNSEKNVKLYRNVYDIMFDSFLDTIPEPFFQILSIRYPEENLQLIKNEVLKRANEMVSFPEFDESSIKNAKSEFKGPKTYSSIQRRIDFYFPFFPDILEEISQIQFVNSVEKEYSECFVLLSYNSWVIIYHKSKKIDYLTLLVKNLFLFLVSSRSSIIMNAIIYLMAIFFLESNLESSDEMLNMFRNLYSSNMACTYFSLFPKIIGRFINSKDEKEKAISYEVLSFYYDIVQNEPYDIIKDSAMSTLKCLELQLMNLDILSIRIFYLFMNLLELSTVKCCLRLIVSGIISRVKQSSWRCYVYKESQAFLTLNPPNLSLGLSFSFSDVELYDFESVIDSISSFYLEGPKIELCDDSLLSVLHIICKGIELKIDLANEIFSGFINEFSNEFSFELFSVFLNICCLLNPSIYQEISLYNCIVLNQVFDPGVIANRILIDQKGINELNTFRNTVLRLIIYEGSNAVNSLIIQFIPYPDLLSEILQRLLQMKNLLTPLLYISSIPKSLAITLQYYNSIEIKSYDQVKKAVSTVFYFLSVLFLDISLANIFFKDQFFSSVFLSFLFERGISDFILSQIKVFLIQTENIESSSIPSVINSIFGIIVIELPKMKNLELGLNLLRMLNEVLSVNPSFSEFFIISLDSLYQNLDKLDSNQISRQFFFEFLNFLNRIPPSYKNSDDMVNHMYKSTCNIFGNDVQDLFISSLSVMYRDSYAERFELSLIRDPMIPKYLFRVYDSINKLPELCDFISQLCRYSSSNCMVLHKCEFDLLLLNSIKNRMKSPNEDQYLIEKILSVFEDIASQSSSPFITRRFLSLFCPIDGSIFPMPYGILFKKLTSLYSSALKDSSTALPLLPDPNLILEKIIENPNKLTFVFWVYIGQHCEGYYPRIVSAITDGDLLFDLYIESCYMNLHDSNKKCYQISTKMNEQSWNFVCMKFKTVSNQCSVSFYINTKRSCGVLLNLSHGSIHMAKFSFGGVLSSSLKPKNAFYLGPLGIFIKLKEEQIISLAKSGYIQLRKTGNKALFFVKTYKSQPRSKKPNLINILTHHCSLDIILPLFSFLKCKYSDGSSYSSFLYDAIDAISNGLMCGEDVEKSFAVSNGFSVIKYLIRSGPKGNINFLLYSTFYLLLQSLFSDDLKKHLIEDFLLDTGFWICSDPEQQLLIFGHWYQTLFHEYFGICCKIKTFSTILNEIVLYFPDQGVKDIIAQITIPKKNQTNDISNSEIRKIFYELLFLLSDINFTSNEYLLIITYCISSENATFVQELLLLVIKIISSNSSTINQLIQLPETIGYLYFLIKKPDPDIVIYVIEIIIEMYKVSPIKNPPLYAQLNVILRYIPSKVYTYSFLAKLLSFVTEKNVELLPIFFWGLSSMEYLELKELINKIPKGFQFYGHNWEIWPMIFVCNSQGQLQLDIISLAIQSGSSRIIQLYNSIEIASKLLGTNSYGIRHQFISQLTNMIMDQQIDPNSNTINQFSSVLRSFLFFRKYREVRRYLLSAFEKSPFADSVETHPSNPKKPKIRPLSPELLLDGLEKYDFKKHKDSFSIKIDSNGKWNDIRIALRGLDVLDMRLEKNHDIIIMISYLLFKDYPDDVKKRISLIEKSGICINGVESLYYLLKLKIGVYSKYKIDGLKEILSLSGEISHISFDEPKIFRKYINSLIESSIHFQEISINYLVISSNIDFGFWKDSQEKESSRIILMENNSKKQWRYIWSMFSVDGAPWEDASEKMKHFQRDQTLCYSYSPSKLKINWEFSNHQIASTARDNGDTKELINSLNEKVILHEREFDSKSKGKRVFLSNCKICTIKHERLIELSIYMNYVSIQYENRKIFTFATDEIGLVLSQTFAHRKLAIELFLTSGKSYFIVFAKEEIKESFNKVLNTKLSKECLNEINYFVSGQYTEDWRSGSISNFQYLIYLNMMGSRSFNSPSQYPIFPWVLSDFESNPIKFATKESYRDFSKAVGAFNNEKLSNIKSIYEDLKTIDPPGHMYSCGPICPLTIYLYFVRVEPFTSLHIQMQSGKFDCAHRIFCSIQKLYKSVYNLANDYRELTPEFFYQHEFLVNYDGFDLGLQNQYDNCDVELPKWAKNPIDFVYLHRKALESYQTSAELHNWIDLMFGYKQKGEHALKGDNLFNPLLLDDIWNKEPSPSSMKRQSIYAAKESLGQLPVQVFTVPHCMKNEIKCDRLPLSFETRSSIIHVFFENNYKGKTELFSLSCDGILTCVQIENFDKFSRTEKAIDGFDISWVSKGAYSYGYHQALLVGNSSQVLNLKTLCVSPVYLSFQCISKSNRYMLYAGTDNFLRLFKSKQTDTPFRTVPFYRDSATCCFLSDVFHLAVIGSNDGYLVLHSIENECHIKTINLKQSVPLHVLVTPVWGFITAVCSKNEKSNPNSICLYTINGEFIRESSIPFSVIHIISFSSRKGFDYIIVTNAAGSIFMSEAYYLDFRLLNVKKGAIAYLTFIQKIQTLIIVSEKGEILFYPLDLEISEQTLTM